MIKQLIEHPIISFVIGLETKKREIALLAIEIRLLLQVVERETTEY